MFLHILKAKLHRATITGCSIEYSGSLTVDEAIMEQAGLLPNEMIWVFNINNGQRFQTYLIPGERGSREIQANGAAARLVEVGDRIIVIASAMLSQEEAADYQPTILVMNEQNEVIRELKGFAPAVSGFDEAQSGDLV